MLRSVAGAFRDASGAVREARRTLFLVSYAFSPALQALRSVARELKEAGRALRCVAWGLLVLQQDSPAPGRSNRLLLNCTVCASRRRPAVCGPGKGPVEDWGVYGPVVPRPTVRLRGRFLDIPVTLPFATATPFRRDGPILNRRPFRVHRWRAASSAGEAYPTGRSPDPGSRWRSC